MMGVTFHWAPGPRPTGVAEPDSGSARQEPDASFNHILGEEENGTPDTEGNLVGNPAAGVDRPPADDAQSASGSRDQAPAALKTETLVAALMTGSHAASESPLVRDATLTTIDRMSSTSGSPDRNDTVSNKALKPFELEVSRPPEARRQEPEDIPVPHRQETHFLNSTSLQGTALEPDRSPAAGGTPDLAFSAREARTSDPEPNSAVTEADNSDEDQPDWLVASDAPEPRANVVPQTCGPLTLPSFLVRVSEASSDRAGGEMARRSENTDAPAETHATGSLLPAVPGFPAIDGHPDIPPAIAGKADRNPQRVAQLVHQESRFEASGPASAGVPRMTPAFLLTADYDQPVLAQSCAAGELALASPIEDAAGEREMMKAGAMNLESMPRSRPSDLGGRPHKEIPADKTGRLQAAPPLYGVVPAEKAGKERSAADMPATVADAKQTAPSGANPALPGLSPAQQVIAGLLTEFRQELNGDRVAAAAQDPGWTPPERMVQKTLRIRLQPESLGDVEIVLRKVAASIKIRIAVDSEETAQVLQRDTGLLHDRLRSLLQDGSLSNLEITVRQPSDHGTGQPTSNTGPGGHEPGSNRRPSPDRDETAGFSGNTRNDEGLSQSHRSDTGTGLVV